MKSTFELRSDFDRLLLALPESARQEISVDYGFCSPLHGHIDVVIRRGDQCMALGRFRPVSQEGPCNFSERFRLAMAYPDDTWYLFDYDGDSMLLNDLSLSDPMEELPDSPAEGLSRLVTIPAEWHAEQKKFQDMKNFLEAMRDLVDEEAFNNPVN
ncbi:MAG: hypothetical protein RIT05_1170 [Bacteroidota bacterium]|jgi:hypothetical protein